MDSITQAALGAAVGEALLGRKIGSRAPIWGAVLGTLPDLDVFFNPLMDEVAQLSWHRGPSHSILFAAVAAPLVALLLRRLHARYEVEFPRWTIFVFLTIVTHPLLDALTNYGTQLFWPFTDWPVAWPSISIVDPLYTVPLLVGVIGAMIVRDPDRSARWNRRGLIVATTYLLLTGVGKLIVESEFRAALEREEIPYEKMMTNPAFFTTLLWQGLAENEEYVWAGMYSWFDTEPVRFMRYPKRRDLIASSLDEVAIRKLLWFSMGYYRVIERDGEIHFDDLHVARMDVFSGERDADVSVFSFRLLTEPKEGPVRFEVRSAEGPEDFGTTLDLFVDRMFGTPYPWEERQERE